MLNELQVTICYRKEIEEEIKRPFVPGSSMGQVHRHGGWGVGVKQKEEEAGIQRWLRAIQFCAVNRIYA